MRWLLLIIPVVLISVDLYLLQPWKKRAEMPVLNADARHFRCGMINEFGITGDPGFNLGFNAGWPLAALAYDDRWFVVTFAKRRWSVDRDAGGTIAYGSYHWNRKLIRAVAADGTHTPWVARLGHRQDTVDDLARLRWTVDDRIHHQVIEPPPMWWL